MRQGFYSQVLKASAVVAATALSSAFDLSPYDGKILVVLNASAQGSGITNAIKLTESATSGGTYTDVAGGGFVTVANAASYQTLELNSDDMMAYMKLDMTVAGGSGTGIVAASVIGFKKYV